MSDLVDELLTVSDTKALELLKSATDDEVLDLLGSDSLELIDTIFRVSDQQITNRIFSISPPELIRRAMLTASYQALGHILFFTQSKNLSDILHQAKNELVAKMINSAKSPKIRTNIVKALPQERQQHWRQYQRNQESEIREIGSIASEAQASLLDERKRLLKEIDEAILIKEQALTNFNNETKIMHMHHESLIVDAQDRLRLLENSIASRETSIQKREQELVAREIEFKEINRRQVQQKIEAKVPEFVTAALQVLEDREKQYLRKASHWTTHGTLVLIIALVSTIIISVVGFDSAYPFKNLPWQAMLFISFKGLVILGVLGLWAKHAFSVSNAYMHEAVKRSDRAHAITFGKLYLEIYGNSVDRKELQDIFENWNITTESAFSKTNSSNLEPLDLGKLAELIKVVDKVKSIGN